MVSINIHSAALRGDTAPSLGRTVAAKLRRAVNAAIPVVVMGLVLVGLVAFRFWATFPAIHDVARG